MKVFPLYEGSYSVDASKKFVPFNPNTDLLSSRKGSLFVHIYPFLVETARELILLDSGLGLTDENGEPQIYANIRSKGYHHSDITKVVMSHLHKDHSGGLTRKEGGSLALNFPEATHYIQSSEMQAALNSGTSSYSIKEIEFLHEHANLELLDGNGKIGDEIRYEISGAHCPAHQVIYIDSASEFYFFGGDVMPETSSLVHNFIAKYDYDGRLARDLRIKYGREAAQEGWTCLFYHDNDSRPVSRIGINTDGSFKILGV